MPRAAKARLNATPKILCLTAHDLDGPDYGAVMRSRNLFKLLAQHGDVRVVLAGENKFAAAGKKSCGGFELVRTIQFQPTPRRSVADRLRNEFDPRWTGTHPFAANAADRAWLADESARHDLVWIHSLPLANAFGRVHWPRTVLDIDDLPSTYYQSLLAQAAGGLEKIRCQRQVFQWRRREKILGERFPAVCVCSDPDRAVLGGAENIFTLPNGFDAPEKNFLRSLATPPRLGFVGKFDYEPNRDGVRWFVKNVWPLILEKVPTARLRLVGVGTEKENWSAHKNIEPLGFVADGAGEMATWSLSIVPVLTGGGTRIKIAEAFSRRCPVVATSPGAYGYEVTDGRELFLADDAKTFAEKCLRLLANPALAETMTATASEKFLQNWTWTAQSPRVAAVVKHVLHQPR
jgi:glycosyltransferase involved in cell wall biosynthesis